LSGKILQTDSFIKYYLGRQPKGRKRSRGQTTKELNKKVPWDKTRSHSNTESPSLCSSETIEENGV
jgi:hypothetical protein